MAHVPAATMVTVFTETVQTLKVIELKLTVKPDVAVALMVKGAAPKGSLDRGPKLIDCAACAVIWKL